MAFVIVGIYCFISMGECWFDISPHIFLTIDIDRDCLSFFDNLVVMGLAIVDFNRWCDWFLFSTCKAHELQLAFIGQLYIIGTICERAGICRKEYVDETFFICHIRFQCPVALKGVFRNMVSIVACIVVHKTIFILCPDTIHHPVVYVCVEGGIFHFKGEFQFHAGVFFGCGCDDGFSRRSSSNRTIFDCGNLLITGSPHNGLTAVCRQHIRTQLSRFARI